MLPEIKTRKFCVENILKARKSLEFGFVLPGLSKGKVGFLNGPPNIGKSYLLQTLAYEVALAKPLVNLIDKKTARKQRVLFLCQEDGLDGFLSRALNQIRIFSEKELGLLEENLTPGTLHYSLINRSANDKMCNIQVNLLIEKAKQYDLVIIDTARKVMGNAREVEEDKLFEDVLDKIAIEADVAVLVSHHLTKLHADRKQKLDINATGGSGLSSTQASSKYHLTLYYGDDKNGETTKLWHTKFNYVPKHLRIKEHKPIVFTQNELDLFVAPNVDHQAKYEYGDTSAGADSLSSKANIGNEGHSLSETDYPTSKSDDDEVKNNTIDVTEEILDRRDNTDKSEVVENTERIEVSDHQSNSESSDSDIVENTEQMLEADPVINIVPNTGMGSGANVPKRVKKIIEDVAKDKPLSPMPDNSRLTGMTKKPKNALFDEPDDDEY